MAKVLKRRRLNPTKRRMTKNQIKFFGTARQKAALKRRKTNPKKRRTVTRTIIKKVYVKKNPIRKRRRNPVSGILSLMNPFGGIKMARKRRVRKTRRNPNYGSKFVASGVKRRKKLRYQGTGGSKGRNRFYKYHYNPRRRRRNPVGSSLLSGTPGYIVSMLGGIAATHFITNLVPMQFRAFGNGLGNVFISGMVASLQSRYIGKYLGNSKAMLSGGLVYTGYQALKVFAPGLVGNLGLGVIGQSSFYTPQMPLPNSNNSFYLPAQVSKAIAAIPAPQSGMGNLMSARKF